MGLLKRPYRETDMESLKTLAHAVGFLFGEHINNFMENNNNDIVIIPIQRDDLPSVVVEHLSQNQKVLLQFGRRIFKVIGAPHVQTFHVGSVGKGSTAGGGLGTSISDSWGIFGNLSSVNMATLNQFRTDIQLRLEDTATHEKIFFEKSFPVEMTLSIESGDIFSIFHVRAKEKNLQASNRKFTTWTPFIAQDDETKQLIPLGTIPPVVIPGSEYSRMETSSFSWAWLLGGISAVGILVLVISGNSQSNNSDTDNGAGSSTSTAINDASSTVTNTISDTTTDDPSALSITVLSTTDGSIGVGMYADKYPSSTTVKNIGIFSGQISAYGAAYKVWIGLKGWTGQGEIGVDGNTGVNLYPIGGSADSGPHISYTEVPACEMCILSGAAPYFASAMEQYNSMYNQNGAYPITIPQGLEFASLSPTLVTYTLPDHNGLSTHGVVYYNPTESRYPYAEAKFVLPSSQANISDFLSRTFISQEDLK